MKAFPYGINKEMDRHAVAMGFPHWSCVSPGSNSWWVRKDGHQCSYSLDFMFKTYMDCLAHFDKVHPMEDTK